MGAVLRGAVVVAAAALVATACTPASHPLPGTPFAERSPPTLAQISQQELAGAARELGSWCPPGAVLVKSVAVDLDRNGSTDAVAIFGCGTPGPGVELAVGLRRAADGSVDSMGTVAADVNEIPGLRTGPDGTVELQASGLGGPVDVPDLPQVLQWRTYRWTGDRFTQTAGPTSFTVSRPELSVTVSDLVFGATSDGTQSGTVTVSVRNNGTAPVPDAAVAYAFALAQKVTPDCGRLSIDGPPSGVCPLPPIAPSTTGTLTLTLIAPADRVAQYRGRPLNTVDGMRVQLRVGDAVVSAQPDLSTPTVR